MFVALGLTVSLSTLDLGTVIVDGLVLGAVLILVARPVAVAVLLAPADLQPGRENVHCLAGTARCRANPPGGLRLDEGVQQGRSFTASCS